MGVSGGLGGGYLLLVFMDTFCYLTQRCRINGIYCYLQPVVRFTRNRYTILLGLRRYGDNGGVTLPSH